MDIATVAQLVGSVGFPIAMCLLIFWYLMKQDDAHAEESRSMREALTELKIAITELTLRLTGKETKNNDD